MTYERPADLPRFSKPPVSEVRIGLVLQPVHIRVTDIPALFALLESAYPLREELPVRPPEFESPRLRRSAFKLEIGEFPALPRIRFRDPENTRWLDLQADSLVCGWRRTQAGEYPSYSVLREEFQNIASTFESYWDSTASEEDLYIVQAGISYYNDFVVDGASDVTEAVGRAYCVTSDGSRFAGLPPVDVAGLNFSFPFETGGDVYAFLTAAARIQADRGSHKARLNLGFRGDPFLSEPKVGPLDAAISFLDTGHDAIVRAFTEISTAEFHKEWGRYQ